MNNYNTLEYFDSFGLLPLNIHFMVFIEKFCNKELLYNNVILQQKKSSVCGYYAIYYIWQRLLNLKPEQIISDFDTNNKNKNDVSVYNIINNTFKINNTKINSKCQRCFSYYTFLQNINLDK